MALYIFKDPVVKRLMIFLSNSQNCKEVYFICNMDGNLWIVNILLVQKHINEINFFLNRNRTQMFTKNMNFYWSIYMSNGHITTATYDYVSDVSIVQAIILPTHPKWELFYGNSVFQDWIFFIHKLRWILNISGVWVCA